MILQNQAQRSWTACTIGDVVAYDGVFTDGDWVESKDQDPNGNVRLIQLADIGDGDFRDKSARFLTEPKAWELNCTFLKEGDLLIARMPDPLGRCCIFPRAGNDKYVTVVDVCAVRLGSSPIDRKYMMYLINTPSTRADIAALQSGSTRKRISRKNLATISLPIAPLNEQHRIVAKIEALFSELDKGVESLRTAREQLKVYRQAVLKHAFEGKLTAQWREENADKLEPPEQLLARIRKEREARYQQQLTDWRTAVKAWEAKGEEGKKPGKPKAPETLLPFTDEKLPKLPDGWCWVPLSWLLSLQKKPMTTGPFGTMLKKNEHQLSGVRVLGIENIGQGRFVTGNKIFVTDQKAKELASFQVNKGDIIISRSGTVGEICEVPGSLGTALISTNLLRVSLNQHVMLSPFFVLMFQGGGGVKSQVKELCKGSSRDFLNQSILKSIAFPICSLPEQVEVTKEIEAKLSCLEKLSEELESSLIRLEVLRQSILKKAFSGQLVPQDPDDEPASVLLERIKAEKAAQANPSKKSKRQKT